VKKETVNLLRKYKILPRKSLGQNFLVEKKVLEKIVEALELKKEDRVVEIGAGTGNLTRLILPRVKKLVALELDPRLFKLLEEELGKYPNLVLLKENVLKISFRDFFLSLPFKVVGNLPYYLASSLLIKLLEEGAFFMVLMVQKEVAERILSSPGERKRGTLTLLIQAFGEVEKIMEISPESFYPSPRVWSTVLRIKRKKGKLPPNYEWFKKVVNASFLSRRKKLRNSLSRGLGIEKEVVEGTLKSLGINPELRAEDLTLEEFIRVSEVLYEKNNP